MPARRYTARNDRSAASDHTIVWRRLTGTPSEAGPGALSAAARMARPAAAAPQEPAEGEARTGMAMMARERLGAEVEAADRPAHLEAAARTDTVSMASRPNSRGARRWRGRRAPGTRPDGGDHQQQPGGLGEAAHEAELDDGAEQGAAATTHGRPARPATASSSRREHRHQHHRQHAEVGLREVEDPVGAVDERHAEGDQRREPADDHAADEQPDGQGKEHELQGEDRRRQRARATRRHRPAQSGACCVDGVALATLGRCDGAQNTHVSGAPFYPRGQGSSRSAGGAFDPGAAASTASP